MTKKDAELDTWSYCLAKYGLEEALTKYYPNLSASDPFLSRALYELRVAQFVIEGRMKELGAE